MAELPRELISIKEAAERLGVREAFVRQMLDKGRLTLQPDDRLDAAQVDELATLMARLRSDGIATMVNVAGEDDSE